MPPRYAFWTLLIDNKPTAFRAREREELLPTFHQLQRKNADIVMKWFARGKLWDTPKAAAAASRAMKAPAEKRAGDWRPGGTHKDPRDRFKKKNRPGHEPRPARDASTGAPRGDRPSSSKPHGRPRGDRPWSNKPPRGKDPKSRRETEPPTKRRDESPASPPTAEQIVTRPKPPERG